MYLELEFNAWKLLFITAMYDNIRQKKKKNRNRRMNQKNTFISFVLNNVVAISHVSFFILVRTLEVGIK